MTYSWDPTHNAAFINLSSVTDRSTVELNEVVIASVDDAGELLGIELLQADAFGTPFDEAAAQRAIEWVRERLAEGAAS